MDQNTGRFLSRPVSRRTMLKGAAGAAAVAAAGGRSIARVQAQTPPAEVASVIDQILKIPGANTHQPTQADMQKVGELCLGPTKAVIKPNEFKGVQFRFMGLNNQNLHNFLFRAFLKPWEDYTGAKITWIDLSQADYNARFQRAISTGTIDFDMLEMGAPFEGDLLGKGLGSPMPEWVKKIVNTENLVNYLKPPVGTWDGVLYRTTIDGDCHNFNYRSDYFADKDLASEWSKSGGKGDWAVPTLWSDVQDKTKFLKGKTIGGQKAYGYLDVAAPWGGFGWYFFASRATAYAKYPGEKAWLFDPATMKPRISDPSFVRAIQNVIDALPYEPPDQISANGNTTGFNEFLGGIGSMAPWWGDIGPAVYTFNASVVQDKVLFSILPGSEDVYNTKTKAWEKLSTGPNFAPNMAYLGWGIYVMKATEKDATLNKACWSAAAHLGGEALSQWTCCYPSGFQPYRTTHFYVPYWTEVGFPKDYITSYLKSQSDSYNHPNSAIEPRIPGIFQYYSAAEDELAKAYAGKEDAQTCANNISATWEKITDQIGRQSQIKLYQAALGS